MRGLVMGRARRRIINDFVAAKAWSRDRAIAYRAGDARTFRRLRSYGAIIDDGSGRYHLDAQRLDAFRGAVRRRVAALVAASGMAATSVAAMTVFALAE